MDEEISIIDTKTRNEKIKYFFIENKKIFLTLSIILILGLLIFYFYQVYKDKSRELISEKYNNTVLQNKNGNKSKIVVSMKEIIHDKDSTYSPLALYYLIDNNLIQNKEEINDLFDSLIDRTSLENEIKNLIIYKKALYNADNSSEKELLDIVNPLINSQSIWKSHALYLVAEFFYSKNEKQKSKEFFSEILKLDDANVDLRLEAQKRLNRDLSD